jgi:hypothetical protein
MVCIVCGEPVRLIYQRPRKVPPGALTQEWRIVMIEEVREEPDRLFCPQHWFGLPLKLRQRWWWETDYGVLKPSPELVEALRSMDVEGWEEPERVGRDISLRIVRETSATPDVRRLWTNDISFEIERGVPFELVERALARVPNEMLGPTTLAFVRQFFGPRAGNGKDHA